MKNLFVLALVLTGLILSGTAQAKCVHPDDIASDGSRCGGRSSDIRPGGR